jgi:hypothetical protein
VTLAEAIDMRLRQAALVGWRVSARRQIVVAEASATLILGWLGDLPLSTADTDDLPSGVTAREWDAPPDSEDRIDVPDEAAILAAAKRLRSSYVARGDAADCTIYWMR